MPSARVAALNRCFWTMMDDPSPEAAQLRAVLECLADELEELWGDEPDGEGATIPRPVVLAVRQLEREYGGLIASFTLSFLARRQGIREGQYRARELRKQMQ
jgi:hypothetical protein